MAFDRKDLERRDKHRYAFLVFDTYTLTMTECRDASEKSFTWNNLNVNR